MFQTVDVVVVLPRNGRHQVADDDDPWRPILDRGDAKPI
jgi:hypothetical protein